MKNAQTPVEPMFTRNLQPGRKGIALLLVTLLVISSLVLINVVGAVGANFNGANSAAQATMTGEWLAEFNRKNDDMVQFTVLRGSAGGGRQHHSSNGIALAELQGLTRQQASGAKTDVNFRLVREAGTFQCEGSFREGKGAGHWTLTPSQSFISAMQSRGYDNLSEDDLFSAALFDLNIKSIEDLKAAGYDRLSFKQLVEASIFKVTGDFAREMKSAGFENLDFKQLVEARIFKVDAQYAREVQAMGFERQPMKSLVEMRIFKITPEFIREMRSMGFENLSLKQLTELRIHSVTPEFVNGLKAEGYASVTPREVITMKIHGVDADFIKRVKGKGFNNLTVNKLVELRIHGIIN